MTHKAKLVVGASAAAAVALLAFVEERPREDWLLEGLPGSPASLGSSYGTIRGNRFKTSGWVVYGVGIGESKKLMRGKFRTEDGWSFSEGKGSWNALNSRSGVLVTGSGLEGDPNFGLQSFEPVNTAEYGADWLRNRGQLRKGEFESCYINGIPPDSSSPFVK